MAEGRQLGLKIPAFKFRFKIRPSFAILKNGRGRGEIQI
jgi:hypothetical protein